MSNLSELLHRAADYMRGLSSVERELMEDQQRRSWVRGETGRDPGPSALVGEVLRLRAELSKRHGQLDGKEIERLERLKRRAYHLQNQIEAKPIRYDMSRSRAEMSALCWAIEKISGRKFPPTMDINVSINKRDG
jgi:hypothetical protein